jgi:hypothetical protein
MSFLELQREDPNERKIEIAMIPAKTKVTKRGVIEE